MKYYAVSGVVDGGKVWEPEYGHHEDERTAATAYYHRKAKLSPSIVDRDGTDMAGRHKFQVVGRGVKATVFVRPVNGKVDGHG